MNNFQIEFDFNSYKDICPPAFVRDYLKHDYVINDRSFEKGNAEECIWKRHVPTAQEIASPEWRSLEATRIIKTGVLTYIKDTLLWVPPNYYFALQYGKGGSANLQFRLKRLKHVYFKIRARNNPGCKGTLTMKNRGDGETTMAVHDAVWEMAEGNMDIGQIGIQSKTRNDAINPCWSYVQTIWQSLEPWIKEALYSDYSSGNNMAEKIKFMRDADAARSIAARNVLMAYYPSGTPMDGKHDMRKCILDEICKWIESEFYHVFTNYSKFIMPGFERRGMFDMFSSPSDVDCKSNEQVAQLWKDSDPNEITGNGTTKSRVHRHYSNPLEGIHGAYDMWGDADPDKIYDWIMQEREKVPKDKLLAEVRGYPLNEQEMFESVEGGNMWSNSEGINQRKIYLLGSRYKNDVTKEPIVVYGNLDWKDGIKDSEPVFRMSDRNQFNVYDSRFCFSYLPGPRKYPLRNIYQPSNYVENVIGIDSVDKRYSGKSPSNLAMVNQKFRDLLQTGINKCPTMIYCNRPLPVEIAYEDAIKAAVFMDAMVQVESLNLNIVNWFEDRGYIDYILSKIGKPKNSLIKGDAPSGKTAFMDEIVGLIDANTNVPILPTDKPLLSLNWFYDLLEDVSKLNLKDTHKNDLSMAWGQALLGAAKILFKKVQSDPVFARQLYDYMFR